MNDSQHLVEAMARGTAAFTKWAKGGELVSAAHLADAWGVDIEILEQAVKQGDLFEVWVQDSPYFVSAMIPLGLPNASMICKLLRSQTSSAKTIFLMRPHGSLGGKTVSEAFRSGTSVCRLCEIASAWTNA